MTTMDSDCHEFLTVREVALLLRVTPRTVQTWIKSGKLAVVRAGRRVLVRRSVALAFPRG